MSSRTTSATTPSAPTQQHWTLDSIDWSTLRRDAVAGNEPLFYLVAGASFVEATTDLYTQNLIDYFSADGEITEWLRTPLAAGGIAAWKGAAPLRAAGLADFDWDGTYRAFLPEFAAQCDEDGVEPTRTREMASRCIVEMGTASFYRTLSRMTDEPVLTELARRIADDEVALQAFLQLPEEVSAGRRDSGAAYRRGAMEPPEDDRRRGQPDRDRHIYRERNGRALDGRALEGMRRSWRTLIRPHFPHRMCVQMLLKPLVSARARTASRCR